jgi:hypothetical protein
MLAHFSTAPSLIPVGIGKFNNILRILFQLLNGLHGSGDPFKTKIGVGKVIKGWDEGSCALRGGVMCTI